MAGLIVLFQMAESQTAGGANAEVVADSNDYIAHYDRGVSFTTTKEYESAIVEYRRALEIYPRYSEAHYAIYCNEILKDTSLLSELSKENPSPGKAAKVAEIKWHDHSAFFNDPFFDRSMAGLFVKAEVIYKPLKYTVDSKYGITFFLKLDGFNRFFHGDYTGAGADFSLMIVDAPEFVQAYYFRGLAYAHLGVYENAVKDFQYVIGKMEQYNKTMVLPIYLSTADLHYAIGCAYLKEGRHYPAEEAFKAALEQNLGLYMANFQLSIVDLMRGSYNPAIRKLDVAIAMEPNDGILHSNKGAILAQQGNFNEAITELKIAVSMMPRFPLQYFHLGQVYERTGKVSEALDSYQHYIGIAPARDSVNVQLARDGINRLKMK
jgi:tetratricopeptide (TPR) repeat protein